MASSPSTSSNGNDGEKEDSTTIATNIHIHAGTNGITNGVVTPFINHHGAATAVNVTVGGVGSEETNGNSDVATKRSSTSSVGVAPIATATARTLAWTNQTSTNDATTQQLCSVFAMSVLGF
jgi:hypothetical protein